MAKGFFLYHLDKTTCGGRILSGAPDDTYHIGGIERQQVRVGDPVTCGKHEGRFRVCGGMGDTYDVGGSLKEGLAHWTATALARVVLGSSRPSFLTPTIGTAMPGG